MGFGEMEPERAWGTLLASGQAKSLELLCMQEHLVSACSSGKEATQCGRCGVMPGWNGNLSTTKAVSV